MIDVSIAHHLRDQTDFGENKIAPSTTLLGLKEAAWHGCDIIPNQIKPQSLKRQL